MSNRHYNVLMLGWEFYPVFAGGMGVVTSEIVSGLTQANIGVHFVIPRLPHKIEVENVLFTSAQDYISSPQTKKVAKDISRNYSKTYVDTVFVPYKTQDLFKDENNDIEFNNQTFVEGTQNIINKNHTSKSIYHSEIWQDIKMFEDKIIEIALDSDFDIIHAHDWITFRAAIKAKHITGKPVVLHVHATESDRSGDNPNKVVFDIEKECLHQADFIIAVSNKGKEDIIRNYLINPEKITVIHNSTTFHQPHIRTILAKKDKIVLFLGRLTMQKGPEYFIYSAEKVLKYLPEIIFVMAGDGDALTQCIELVNKLNIEKNFVFTGFVTGEYKERLFASADLFVMPSVSEPFGVVALEAIKSGTPVLVSKTSGASEIISNALKVDFWDINKISDMIHATLKYPSLNSELTERQVNDLDSQNWNHQVDVIIEVYKKAISEAS